MYTFKRLRWAWRMWLGDWHIAYVAKIADSEANRHKMNGFPIAEERCRRLASSIRRVRQG